MNCAGNMNTSASSTASAGIAAGSWSIVTNCTANGNSGTGAPSAFSNPGLYVGDGSVVRGCVANGNTGGGIKGGKKCVIQASSACDNLNTGIVADSASALSDCTATSNPFGISVADGSSVVGCVVRQNGADGIAITGGCRIVENTCDQNAIGIHGTQTSSRIEGNNVTFNTTAGIRLNSGGNTVFKNSARGNPTNYDVAGNDVGPISTAASATSPFANIVF
jgi:parallel beta-helix repeat protein